MTGQSTFQSDLQRSQAIETKLCDIIINAGHQAKTTQDKGHYSGYDIIINGKKTIELKVDYESECTGNIAVEISKVINDKEQKSGLSITTADYYVYHLPYEPEIFYFIETRDLKGIKDKAFRMVRGGDNNSVWLRLYRKDVFLSYCTKIDASDIKSVRQKMFRILHPSLFRKSTVTI